MSKRVLKSCNICEITIERTAIALKRLTIYFSGQCRHLEFGAEQAFRGKRLVNHLIRAHDPLMTDFCDALCYMEHNCASYNLMKRSEAEGHRCELNNATHEGNENDLEENPDYVYRGTKVRTVSQNELQFCWSFKTIWC